MVALRPRLRNLPCFYCGKRSGVQFTGQTSFICTFCDATNWLDERGDITDPPTSVFPTESPQAPRDIARGASFVSVAPSVSPPRSTPDPIFCETCLTNQRNLVATLRNFEFPDDPNDPEYAARERNFRRWKHDLEKRYPQVCANCEPKVQKQLRHASYTAKTDHIRRMMNRTRDERAQVKRRGLVDLADMIGNWAWHLAFMLQFLWHFLVLGSIFVLYEIPNFDGPRLDYLRVGFVFVINRLPHATNVIRWTVNTGLMASLWNPKFKQTIRGFTSHILGFRQWYSYQLVILVIRCVCLFISQYNDAQGVSVMSQVAAHLGIFALMFYVYCIAGDSIRIDTTPLFGSAGSIPVSPSPSRSARRQVQNELGNILDEIMESTPSTNAAVSAAHQPRLNVEQNGPRSRANLGSSFQPLQQPRHTSRQLPPFFTNPPKNPQQPTTFNNSFGSLSLSSESIQPRSQSKRSPAQYNEEMDWQPSGSQHRAFSTHNPFKVKNPNPRFNDAPIEEKPGPFWYKVPPAPTNPAQRLRNPPNKPIIRQSPKEKKDLFFQNPNGGSADVARDSSRSRPEIIFKNPSFYAPEDPDDPRDNLSRLMGSFSISPDPDESQPRLARTRKQVSSGYDAKSMVNTRAFELLGLVGALWAWVRALGTSELYGKTLALGAVISCLMVSIRLGGDLLAEVRMREGQNHQTKILSWANVAVGQVVAALLLTWRVWAESNTGSITCGLHGNVLFSFAIVHQMWHVFT